MRAYEDLGIDLYMDGSGEMIGLLNRYADGAIGKEDFIRRYDPLVRMVYAEAF